METRQDKKSLGHHVSRVLNNPTPRFIRFLMGAMTAVGISQGLNAFLRFGAPAMNAILIALLPVFGGVVGLYLFIPLLIQLEQKKNEAAKVSSAFYVAFLSGSLVSAIIVGLPLLFLWSKSLGGMPFHGLCQALLIPHWYHFALAAVVGMTWPCHVLWVWAHRSTKVSKPENVVLQPR